MSQGGVREKGYRGKGGLIADDQKFRIATQDQWSFQPQILGSQRASANGSSKQDGSLRGSQAAEPGRNQGSNDVYGGVPL